jgi:hypothetical protein
MITLIATLDFAVLAIATLLAAAIAAALHWLFLRVAFVLMHPATARRIPGRTDLVRGTTQLARSYVANR